ncbi:MAG: RHS repeat-associated core domain-containing protein, partial [Pseudomonadota bacterium]
QTTSYTYDNGERLIRKDYHNGTYALYTHDNANHLLSVINKDSLDSTLSSYSYQYDNAGNRTRMTEEGGDQTDYTYDDLYRLTGVTYPDSTTASYTYDAVGNRTQLVDSGTTNYTYDNADRLLSAGSISYGWDSNGNQISKVEGGNTTTYAYDYENRMTGITFPDSSANSFIYYPDGRRFNLTDKAGTATYYLYDNFDTLVEANSSGTTTARYTSGLGIDDWISMDRGGSSYAYQHDGLGSVVGLTDDSETLVASYSYDVFGSVRSETGNVVNPYRFTGRKYDGESELYFYRSRYYDPEIGRFITKDVYRGIINFSETLHRYAYVGSNKMVYS